MKRCQSDEALAESSDTFGKSKEKIRYKGRPSLPTKYGVSSAKKKTSKAEKRYERQAKDYYLDEIGDDLWNYEAYRCLNPVTDVTPSSSSVFSNTQDMDSSIDESPDPIEELRKELEAFNREEERLRTVNVPEHVTMRSPSECFVIINKEKHKLGDVIWLYLQTFFANRPLNQKKFHISITKQSSHIMKMRQDRVSILDEIKNFKIDQDPIDFSNWLYVVYDSTYTNFLQTTMIRVKELLDRFESFWALFPNWKSMKVSTDKLDNTVILRVTLMYMWYNNLENLFKKIREVGQYFGIIDDVRKRNYTFSGMTPSSPNHLTVSHSSSTGGFNMWPKIPVLQDYSEHHIERTERNESSSSLQSVEFVDTLIETGEEGLGNAFVEMYRGVVGRSLRLRGMLEILERLRCICQTTLEKACLSLLTPRLYAQAVGCSNVTNATKVLKKKFIVEDDQDKELTKKELDEATVNNREFIAMNLPSFYHHFLFLVRVPVDLVHQWLKMRSEKVVDSEWDLLTLNTLIEDSHDCLQAAINVKNFYIDMVSMTTNPPDEQIAYLESFDHRLDTVFQNYLSYLRHWTQTAARPSHVDVEWCDKVVKKIINEWERAKKWSASVNQGEATSARRFCDIGQDLLHLLVKGYLEDKFDAVETGLLDIKDSSEDELYPVARDQTKTSSIFVLCRAFKEMIRNLRERALKSLSFIRTLTGDLEICARYQLQPGHGDELVRQLLEKNHVLLSFTNFHESDHIVLCNTEIVNNYDYLDMLLNATCVSQLPEDDIDDPSNPKKKLDRGYLVLIPSKLISTKPRDPKNWSSMKLSLKTKTTLENYITTNDIYLISENRPCLDKNRQRFEKAIHQMVDYEHIQLIDDFCSCNDQISGEIDDIKRRSFGISNELWEYAEQLPMYILNGKDIDSLADNEYDSLKATLLQAYNVAFEYHKDLARIVSLSMREEFSKNLVKFLKNWSSFIVGTVKGNHRSIPRWATIPISYLQGLMNHSFIRFLDGEEEIDFVNSVKAALVHIQSSSIQNQHPHYYRGRESLESTSNEDSYKDLETYYFSRKVSVTDRLKTQIDMLDAAREQKLFSQRKIGRFHETKDPFKFDAFFMPTKRAPFEWQRLENKKLGTGSFGDVYLVMNLRDNCLMAMKQIQIKRENNAHLKALVDEVDILRNLDHPNLVKYYGIEVHKDEILIFMEYCSEGTLARVCREGLDLACVRRYAHYLLKAVAYIHDQHIVHRDIKPENIFLTRKDVLKLGDFGCSFRLHDTVTRFGEIVNYVGTTQYMAPEIQTNGGVLAEMTSGANNGSSFEYVGYGRAVDIWSTGCVVLEMLTGKKPYHYLNHEFQIIYHLGSGQAPRLTPEIKNCELTHSFLKKCFTIDQHRRPTAVELLQDPFANINPDEYDQELP